METQTDPSVVQNKKTSDTKKIAVLLGILVMVVIGISLRIDTEQANSDRFYHTETINGIEVKGLTKEEAAALLLEQYQTVTPTITLTHEGNYSLDVESKLLGFELSSELLLESIGHLFDNQLSLANPASWLNGKHHRLDIEYQFQEPALESGFSQLQQLLTENWPITENQNAYLRYNQEDGFFEIVEEIYGNQLSYERLTHSMAELGRIITNDNPNDFAHRNIMTLDLRKWDCYDAPQRTAANLQGDLVYFNQNFTSDLVISITQDKTAVLEPMEYLSFFNIHLQDNEVHYDALEYMAVKEDALYNYMADFCNSLNTLGIKRAFTTSTGVEIVLTTGNYGWWVNRQKTYENVLAMVQSLQTEQPHYNAEVVYNQTASVIPDLEAGVYDYGNSYVEISIAAQHLWYYVDGNLILETDIVSGNPNNGQATPPGVYSITYKERNATLTGPGYRTPVSYWMPFNGDIGLHDATWQSAFGGNRYLAGYGSNGCINMPFDKAALMYEHINQFDPVIVY